MSTKQGFKAVIIYSYGDRDKFALADNYTEEIKEGFVRVHIKAAGFNPIDCKLRTGLFGGSISPQGLILGIDFSGVVAEVGTGVQGFAVGDEVYGLANGIAGKEGGSYAEQVVISQHLIAKKPANVSHEHAASLVTVGLTAADVIHRGKVEKSKTVLIAGASGGVGSHAVQLARNLGAKVIATVGSQESFDYVRNVLHVDPENIINYKGLSLEALVEKVHAANGGNPVDVALDLVGGLMKNVAVESVDYDGNVVTIVEEKPDFATHLYPLHSYRSLFFHNATFHTVFPGAHSFSSNPVHWRVIHRKLEALRKLIEDGALQAVSVHSVGSLSVETVRAAHEQLETGHVKGKLVMTVN